MASESSDEFLVQLIAALTSNDQQKISDLIQDDSNASKLKQSSWDLVSHVCSLLTETNCEQEGFCESCESILLRLCEVSNVKELLLALLEQADSFKDDVRFLALLTPLQKCLMQLPSRRGHSVTLVLETLYAHIATLPKTMENQVLTGHERKLLDIDETVCRGEKLLTALLDFMEPLIEDAKWQNSSDSIVKQRDELTKCLIKLLDYPVAHFDLIASKSTKGENYAPRGRGVAVRIAKQLARLHANFAKQLLYYRRKLGDEKDKVTRMAATKNGNDGNHMGDDERDDVENDDVENDDDVSEPTPELGVSTFAYLVFSEQLESDNLPQVMSYQYWLEFNIPFITCLLTKPQWLIQEKGVALFGSIVSRIPVGSLPGDFCGTHRVKLLLQSVLLVMCQGPSKETSQAALKHFTTLLWCFEPAGRYRFILFILYKSKHAGVVGYCITQLKEVIDHNLARNEPINAVSSGASLNQLLKAVFVLPDCETTDLMEHSAQVMAALNLLRYLVLRDKPAENATGIWSLLPDIEKTYCTNLRTAIKMSRAHFEVDLEKVKTKKKKSAAGGDDVELEMTVGSDAVPAISREQKIELLSVALHTFDMMESVLGRVSELVDQAKRAEAVMYLNCRLIHYSARARNEDGSSSSQTAGSSDNSEQTDDLSEDALKSRILNTALMYVPVHGWSVKSLQMAVEKEGFPAVSHGMFPRGSIELVDFFYVSCNEKLATQMRDECARVEKGTQEKRKTRAFIADHVQTRLTMITPYVSNWHQAMGLMALPGNVPGSLRNLNQLCDDIWYYAGDRSVNTNYYTKRLSLAAIYKSSELYLLQDKSHDYQDTWQFLNRRIDDLESIGGAARQIGQQTGQLNNIATSLFMTASNMLGVNNRRR